MTDDVVQIADFSLDEFIKVSIFPHPTQMSIMPVVAVRDDQFRILGTCFAVSNHGLVLTARHVLDDVISVRNKSSDGWQVGALYVSEPTPGDNIPDLLGGLILANRVHACNEFDIGAMHLNLPVRVDDGTLLKMPALKLSPALPKEGELCLALGYHNMKIQSDSEDNYLKTIEQSYSASKGVIEEIHFPKRDSSNLTFPCFRTSLRHEPGMSGAPILSKDGGVLGVVCSAFKGQDLYYGSLIGPALFLQIDVTNAEDNDDKLFLYDFFVGGSIGIDETINQLDIYRQEKSMEINFGIPPTMRGEIGE